MLRLQSNLLVKLEIMGLSAAFLFYLASVLIQCAHTVPKNKWTTDSFLLATLDSNCCGIGPNKFGIIGLCDPDNLIFGDEGDV